MTESPEVNVAQLKDAISFLDDVGFRRTERLPFVTARQWSPGAERTAYRRFREGLSNVEEVGIPRLYWRKEKEHLVRYFRALTLGLPDPELAAEPRLRVLYAGGTGGRPKWSVLVRFDRYILRSHPDDEGRDFVYFGDDTLFLMERVRELLRERTGARRLLDLCCGGGGVSLALPEFDGTVTGVDLNPVSIELASAAAQAQGLDNYTYRCADMMTAFDQKYDLVFGNPPTLSPTLTGRDVFHATGTIEAFQELLPPLIDSLEPSGMALLTVFDGDEESLQAIRQTTEGLCGFRYIVRRQFALGGGRTLRHCALELYPDQKELREVHQIKRAGMRLPALSWRRKP